MILVDYRLVIGEVTIVDCLEFHDVDDFNKHRDLHCLGALDTLPYLPITYAWVLADPVLYPPTDYIHVNPRHGAHTWVKMWLSGVIVGVVDTTRTNFALRQAVNRINQKALALVPVIPN